MINRDFVGNQFCSLIKKTQLYSDLQFIINNFMQDTGLIHLQDGTL